MGKWVATGVIAAVTGVVVTALAGTGYGWVSALDTPVSPTNWSVSSTFGRLTGDFGLWRWICLGLAAAIALRAWKKYEPIHALGLTLAAFALLGPALRPWYLLWGLIPLAAAKPNQRWLAVLSGLLALAVFPHGYPPDLHELTLAALGGFAGLGFVVATGMMFRKNESRPSGPFAAQPAEAGA